MHGYKWPINCTRTRTASLPVWTQSVGPCGADEVLVYAAAGPKAKWEQSICWPRNGVARARCCADTFKADDAVMYTPPDDCSAEDEGCIEEMVCKTDLTGTLHAEIQKTKLEAEEDNVTWVWDAASLGNLSGNWTKVKQKSQYEDFDTFTLVGGSAGARNNM